jgi:Tol biopolymer transport system component
MNLWRARIDEKSGRVLGKLEPITTPSPYSGPLSISRDGKRIVYTQQITTANIQKAAFDPVKEAIVSEPQWITQGSRQARHARLSPDGEWLAFSEWGKQEDLFVVKTDGTGLRQLTNDIYKDRMPRSSPNAKRIAFSSNRGGKYDIWLINVDGSGLEQLTNAPTPDVNHRVWSPDGNRLVYTAAGNAFVMELTKPWKEQSPRPLAVPPEFRNRFYASSWSPDGWKLAGVLWKPDVTPDGVGIFSLESGKLERLVGFGGYMGPVWLSDSRRLIFPDRGKLYLTDSESKKTHEILSVVVPHEIDAPSLSRDDRVVYFSVVVKEADIWLATFE